MDLSGFGLMKYFFTNLFVINSTDYDEINRSLEGITIYKYDLEKQRKIGNFSNLQQCRF